MTDLPPLASDPLVRRVVPPLLLVAMVALLIGSSLHKRLVYDEYDNLSYGYRFLTKGPGVAPEGQRMPVLALNALGCLSVGCDLEAVNASERIRLQVRAASMVFALATAVLVWRWATRLFGVLGGLAGLWLAVFDPTLLAHGKQVTSDVAVAAFMLAAVYAYTRWHEEPTTTRFVAIALATAGAILSKFSGLLLVPVLTILVAIDLARAWRAGARPTRRQIGRGLGLAVGFAAIVVLAINAAYLFRGTMRPAASYAWKSAAFQRHATWPVPIPLPRVFVQGLDYSSDLQENPMLARGANYVLGERNRDGRWYAFPLMVLLKTPLAVFVLAAIGLRARAPRGVGTWLAVPFLVVMLFFSFAVDPQLGIRYVLPALPFLTLGAARAGSAPGRGRAWTVAALLVWQAVSTLSYYPHFVPYFNELIGHRLNAYRYLADSNLDWEDHAYWIEQFQRKNPRLRITVDPPEPTPGWVLVSANELVGVFDPEKYRWLRERFAPIRHVAYAHLLFYVPANALGPASPPTSR